VINKIEKEKNYNIDGIRNAAEVEKLKEIFGGEFHLISVDADLETRWRKAQNRGKESDPKTFEEFLEADKRDFEENLENGQQVKKCMGLADYSCLNNGTIEELREKLKIISEELKC
jgi:dephospho-CoA kinase